MFYEELTRLGILDEEMAPGFVLGIDLSCYIHPYSIYMPQGPLWAAVSPERFLHPVHNDERDCYEARDQYLFVNNNRYPNNRYVTLSSKHGRKICRNGAIWTFPVDMTGRALYLTFSFGQDLFDAMYFAVKLMPQVLNPEDMTPRNTEAPYGVLPVCGLKIRGIAGGEIPADGEAVPFPEQVSLCSHRFTGTGWKSECWCTAGSDNDPGAHMIQTEPRTESGYSYRIITDEIPVPVSAVDKCMF